MRGELRAVTEAGAAYVALAESHVADLARSAEAHDREGTFVAESIAALQASGLLAASVPAEFGGLGNASIHDQMVAVSRLGRGDGSAAIAANMHLAFSVVLTRQWTAALAAGYGERAAALAAFLASIARKEAICCALITEPGTDLLHPRTTATRTEGGWLLDGRKAFGTLSEVATHAGFSFRLGDGDGPVQRAGAIVSLDRDGIAPQRNWDALGMRGSGSQDVVLKDVFVPAGDVFPTGLEGEYDEGFLASNMIANFGLLGAFLGIAEAAHAEALRLVTSRRSSSGKPLAESHAIQHTVAEMEIDLAASRAVLARTAQAADAFFAVHPADAVPLPELHLLVKDFQCTKWIVNRKAIEVVDRALQLSGGSGYLSKSVLSRLYRDVRAGPFMQPFSPNEAFQYIGKVALGLDPRIE